MGIVGEIISVFGKYTKITDQPLQYFQKTHAGLFSVNTMTKLDIPIDPAWRESSGHEPGQTKIFYAKIKTTLYHNEDVRAGNPADEVNEGLILNTRAEKHPNVFRNTFCWEAPDGEPVAVQFNPEDHVVYGGFCSKEQGKGRSARYRTSTPEEYDTSAPGVILEGQQPFFTVRYDTMDVILEEYEAKKNTMMAVAGDVGYSHESGGTLQILRVRSEGRRTPGGNPV